MTHDRRASRMESEYYAHMGFDPEHQREVLRFYIPMFAEPVDGAPERKQGPVLEIGCGRGEFLGLLRDAGIRARGVDIDPGMVQTARSQGFDVIEDDALRFLHAEPAPGPYQGVFCAHFIEHLTPERVVHFLEGARRVLAPGGRLVAVTPNPACYAVLSHDFWWDPTHVRFYDVALVEFLCRQAGFEVESSGTNPANHPGPPPQYLAGEPVVHPGVGDLVGAAMGKLAAAVESRRDVDAARADASVVPVEQDPPGPERPDPTWAYELAHVVNVLGDRLQETTQALRELRSAYDNLVWGLYQGNETFVMARR
ncbi:MAG TPA: class I SAM-dependent methyltransferase [Actinomycetes bacterium]|nr:class I SAM-dependent methyltransferase [Actinomycetes bacterium]